MLLYRWVLFAANRGLDPDVEDILDTVEMLLKEEEYEHNFSTDRPGLTWFRVRKYE